VIIRQHQFSECGTGQVRASRPVEAKDHDKLPATPRPSCQRLHLPLPHRAAVRRRTTGASSVRLTTWNSGFPGRAVTARFPSFSNFEAYRRGGRTSATSP